MRQLSSIRKNRAFSECKGDDVLLYRRYFVPESKTKESWTRCANQGIDPELLEPRIRLSFDEAFELKKQNAFLLDIAEPILTETSSLLYAEPHGFFVCDIAGYVIAAMGHKGVYEEMSQRGFRLGTSFTEESIGASSLAVSIQSHSLAVCRPEQHYLRILRAFYSASCPLRCDRTPVAFLNLFLSAGSHSVDPCVALVKLAAELISHHISRAVPGIPFHEVHLSGRHQDVLRLLAMAYTTRQIAATLHISESTAKDYIREVYRRVGARNRVECLTKALRLQLLDCGRLPEGGTREIEKQT